MARGDFTDTRTSWFFQALILSAPLNSAAVTNYDLVAQAGHVWSDLQGAVAISLPSSTTIQEWYGMWLYAEGPWDELLLVIFIDDVGNSNGTVRLYVDHGAGFIQEISIATTLTGWLSNTVDISAWAAGGKHMRVDWANGAGGASVVYRSTHVMLVNSGVT